MGFINKYTNESAYSADTARPTDKSTVSLVEADGKVHFDGVNIKVKRPKPGDAVCVPSACGYNAKTAPSGTPVGEVTFIAGESYDESKMPNTMESVGVVATVEGDNVYVLWKTGSNTMTYFEGATSSAYNIPNEKIDADALSSVTATDIMDMYGRIGVRQACSLKVLEYSLKNIWNGGTDVDDGYSIYNYFEWMKVDNTLRVKTVPDSTYAAFGDSPDKPSESAWKRYLESRCVAFPSRYPNNVIAMDDGRKGTKVFVDANETIIKSAFFKPHHFAYNHSEVWNSYGRFYNVDGLKYGEWFMPGMKISKSIFEKVVYSVPGTTVTSDPYNRTLQKMGGQTLRLSSGGYTYWLPFVRSRSYAWFIYFDGYFGFNRMSSNFRALSVALLKINP